MLDVDEFCADGAPGGGVHDVDPVVQVAHLLFVLVLPVVACVEGVQLLAEECQRGCDLWRGVLEWQGCVKQWVGHKGVGCRV